MKKPIAAALAAAILPLVACSTTPDHVAVSREAERRALVAAEAAYAEAYAAYVQAGNLSPADRVKAHNALAAAHSALQATLNAFEADGAPTFMDQAVAARRLADEAKAAAQG